MQQYYYTPDLATKVVNLDYYPARPITRNSNPNKSTTDERRVSMRQTMLRLCSALVLATEQVGRGRAGGARTLEDVGDLGGVGVAGEREAAGGERELGGADGGDAEHGQVGGAPLVVGAALAAVRLPRLPRGQIHGHRADELRFGFEKVRGEKGDRGEGGGGCDRGFGVRKATVARVPIYSGHTGGKGIMCD